MLVDFVSKIVRDDVRAIKAYPVAPAAGMVKLDAMENPYRLPDALRDELGRAVATAAINRYPDPAAPALKARLREVFEIPADAGILLGNGSDEIIAIVTQTLARPGAAVLAPEPSFVMYRMNAHWNHVRYVGVPLRADFSLDADAFLARMRARRRRSCGSPIRTIRPATSSARPTSPRIIAAAPGLVVLDEAYHVFAGKTFMHADRRISRT